jgi:hypothetical protein
MAEPKKTSTHTHAVGAWGKDTAVRLLNAASSGFKNAALHDGYILASKDGHKYLFAVAARDELKEDGTLNKEYNIYPDELMAEAQAIGAIPAWLTIPIDRKKREFSWGLVTQLPLAGRNRYRKGVPMENTLKYQQLARREPDPKITDIFSGKR